MSFFRSNRASNTFTVSLPVQSRSFPGTTENSHDCASPVYHDRNEVCRLAYHKITCSELETFLARQCPQIHFQHFERMHLIVHPLLTCNGAVAASKTSFSSSELLFNRDRTCDKRLGVNMYHLVQRATSNVCLSLALVPVLSATDRMQSKGTQLLLIDRPTFWSRLAFSAANAARGWRS